MLQQMPNETRSWKTAEDVYNWWLYNDKAAKQEEGQMSMEIEDE